MALLLKGVKGKSGVEKTLVPHVSVKWSIQCPKNHGARIRAYAWDDVECIRIDGCADHYKKLDVENLKIDPQKEIEKVREQIIEVVMAEYRAAKAGKKISPQKKTGGRFRAVYERIQSEAPDMMDHFRWAESTREESLTYLKNKVIPLLDEFEGELADEDIKTVRDRLCAQALKNRR